MVAEVLTASMHEHGRIVSNHLLVPANHDTDSLLLNVPDEDARFLLLLSTAAKCAVLRLGAAAPPALLERFAEFAWIPLLRCRHPSLDAVQSQVVEEIVVAVAPTQPWNVVHRTVGRCVGSFPPAFDFPQDQQPDGYAGRLPRAETLRLETAVALAAALLTFAAGGAPSPSTSSSTSTWTSSPFPPPRSLPLDANQQTYERRRVLQQGCQILAGLLQSTPAMPPREQRLLASSLLPAGLNAAAAMGADSYRRAGRQLALGVRGMIAPARDASTRAAGWTLLSLTPAPVLGPPGAAAAAVTGAVVPAAVAGGWSSSTLPSSSSSCAYFLSSSSSPFAAAEADSSLAAAGGRLAVVRSAVEAARSGAAWTPPDLDALRRAELKVDVRRRTDDDLLDALACGLAAEDATERRAALAALRHCVGPVAADAAPWLEFVAVYTSLEDFAAHLVGAAWAHLETLHPQARQMSEPPKPMPTPPPTTPPRPEEPWTPPVDYRYVLAMWTRGLRHDNPAVRQSTLEALCGRDWSGENALLLTPRFVCEVLLPCAMDIAKLGGGESKNAYKGGGGGGNGNGAGNDDGCTSNAASGVVQDGTATTTTTNTTPPIGAEVARVCAAWVTAVGTQDRPAAFSAALAIAAAVAERCRLNAAVSPAGLDLAAHAAEAAAVAAERSFAQAPTVRRASRFT